MTEKAHSRTFVVLAATMPALAVLLVQPFPILLSYFWSDGRTETYAGRLLMVVPFWFAVLSAPAYYLALFAPRAAAEMSGSKRVWITASLWTIVVAGGVGTVLTLLIPWATVPALLSTIFAFVLFRDVRRQRRAAQATTAPAT